MSGVCEGFSEVLTTSGGARQVEHCPRVRSGAPQ